MVRSKRKPKREPAVPEEPQLRFVYLTRPQSDDIVLNINVAGEHARYKVSRDQLLLLNEQIVEAIVRNRLDGEQFVLDLEKVDTN